MLELFEVTPLSTIQIVQDDVLDHQYAQLIFYYKCMIILYRQRILRRRRVIALDSPTETVSGGRTGRARRIGDANRTP